jgi:hypothetical protein
MLKGRAIATFRFHIKSSNVNSPDGKNAFRNFKQKSILTFPTIKIFLWIIKFLSDIKGI